MYQSEHFFYVVFLQILKILFFFLQYSDIVYQLLMYHIPIFPFTDVQVIGKWKSVTLSFIVLLMWSQVEKFLFFKYQQGKMPLAAFRSYLW